MMQPTIPSTWAGHESVLRPSSPPAHAVSGLFTFMVVVSLVVYAAVIATLLYAVARARRNRAGGDAREDYADDTAMRRSVAAAAAGTILILFVYLVYDFGVGRANAEPVRDPSALRIHVTGHQWWWEVHYSDPSPQRQLTTANEIHVPIHRRVLFSLTSTDVIHSFWIPNLNGKRDLIPGHANDAWFEADTVGVYRGQCAEFCGLQHANMAIIVVAETPEQFRKWYEAQLQPAAPPANPDRAEGQKVFLAGSCVMCHAISGTPAGATFGPDLTHIGSRMTIAAGVLPNTPANLAGWIADPQSIKPGSKMPANSLSPHDLRALLAYLEGLQ